PRTAKQITSSGEAFLNQHTRGCCIDRLSRTTYRDLGTIAEPELVSKSGYATIRPCGLRLPIRLAKSAWDLNLMRVWPAVQKLPARAAPLRWQRLKAHLDQTGLLQTERNAANETLPRPQANPSHSQQPQA